MFENTFKANHKLPDHKVIQLLANSVEAINQNFHPGKSLKFAEMKMEFSPSGLVLRFTADVGYDRLLIRHFQRSMREQFGENCFKETHIEYDCELEEPVIS